MSEFLTEQEKFWASDFGNEYTERNAGPQLEASALEMFGDILSHTSEVSSVLEFGANRGLNIKALRALRPECNLSAIEINPNAAEKLGEIGDVEVFQQSILTFENDKQWDLTFTRGVLIHINPDHLPDVYERLYHRSRKYILVCEYYNPAPVEISYRGHEERLYKRDFAGELMDRFSDLKLVKYGFRYHRDPVFPQDDVTWFLMQKK